MLYQYLSESDTTAGNTVPDDLMLTLNHLNYSAENGLTFSSSYSVSGSSITFTANENDGSSYLTCDTALIEKWVGYGVEVSIASAEGNTYIGKLSLDSMMDGTGKLFDRTFTSDELATATITATFGHGIKEDHILDFTHFYRLGGQSILFPDVIGEEVTGTFDLEHRMVLLNTDTNGMFRAFETELEKAPTPTITLHMGGEDGMIQFKNNQEGYQIIPIIDGVVPVSESLIGGKHSVQCRVYGDNIMVSDVSNTVEVTTAAIKSLSANWTISGATNTAVAPVAYTPDSEEAGEHRVVQKNDGTCAIVDPTADCVCQFAPAPQTAAASEGETGSASGNTMENATEIVTENGASDGTTEGEAIIYPDANSVMVLRGSYSFIDFFSEQGGKPSGDVYENYTYNAETGIFRFPNLREDVYIYVKG